MESHLSYKLDFFNYVPVALGFLGLLGLPGLVGLLVQGALLGLGLLLALPGDLAAAGQFLARQLAVFFAQLARRLAVQVKAFGGLGQRDPASPATRAGYVPDASALLPLRVL